MTKLEEVQALETQLLTAKAELESQSEPARLVASLEGQIAQLQTEIQAEANLVKVKADRQQLSAALSEFEEAKATMNAASAVALECWIALAPLIHTIARLRGPAMAESTAVPTVDCPVTPATRAALGR